MDIIKEYNNVLQVIKDKNIDDDFKISIMKSMKNEIALFNQFLDESIYSINSLIATKNDLQMIEVKNSSKEISNTEKTVPISPVEKEGIQNISKFIISNPLLMINHTDVSENDIRLESANIDVKKLTTSYNKIIPQISLTDKEMNRIILNNREIFTDELIFYLRMISHQCKPELLLQDKIYLQYLLLNYDINYSVINYLMKNTSAEDITKEELIFDYQISDNEQLEAIDLIENYIREIKNLMTNSAKDRISLIVSETEISLSINPKKTIYQKEMSKNYFDNMIIFWGFLYFPVAIQ